MCTVTFIPTPGKIFLTSNRDESANRPLALPPAWQVRGGYRFISPCDGLAGGTWVALRDDGSALVLLNGAVEKHSRLPAYRRSRGQIFWDIFATDCTLTGFVSADLENIEPFTLVLWQKNKLHEMLWDGRKKTRAQKDAGIAHIWSSCTLYSDTDRICRENFFRQWLASRTKQSVAAIKSFHLYTDPAGKSEASIRINRNGEMLTVSVSCMEIGRQKSTFYYHDLQQGKNYLLLQ
jgi:uncharacterized protein with NRDE domain